MSIRPFFEERWRRSLIRDLRVVPRTEEVCEARYCAVLVTPEGPKKNRGCFKPLSRVIDHLMEFPENRNFYIHCRRVYVCLANGTWTKQNECKRSVFFNKLRERIWEKYVPLVLEALERQGTSPAILLYARDHMRTHPLRMSNEDLERYLTKHNDVLHLSWFNRRRG